MRAKLCLPGASGFWNHKSFQEETTSESALESETLGLLAMPVCSHKTFLQNSGISGWTHLKVLWGLLRQTLMKTQVT